MSFLAVYNSFYPHTCRTEFRVTHNTELLYLFSLLNLKQFLILFSDFHDIYIFEEKQIAIDYGL